MSRFSGAGTPPDTATGSRRRRSPAWWLVMTVAALSVCALHEREATAAVIVENLNAGAGLNIAIPDAAFTYDFSPGGTATSAIQAGPQANSTNVIAGVALSVNINHPMVGDLVLALEAPDGTLIYLANRPGLSMAGEGDLGEPGGYAAALDANIPLTFDDFAPSGVGSELMGNGLFPGQAVGVAFDDFIPTADGMGNASLSSLAGASSVGTWRLHVGDAAAGGSGTLESWSLTLTTVAIPEPSSLALLGVLGGCLIRRRRRR